MSGPTFEGLRYSRVWEDHRVLECGLAPTPDDDVLSICSGGCNVLALALAGVRSVTAVDVNMAQLALLGLHVAAARTLEHAEYVVLVGARPIEAGGPSRIQLYERVRDLLSDAHCAFWDAHTDVLAAGAVDAGRLERHFAAFATVLDDAQRRRIRALAAAPDLAAQRGIASTLEADADFAMRFREHFGTEGLGGGGRSPQQYVHVEEADTGGAFLSRALADLRTNLVRENVYALLFWTGAYPDERHTQPHLAAANHARLRRAVERIEMVQATVTEVAASAPTGTYSKVNLSDVYEYHSTETMADDLQELGARMRPGGRAAWWSLLAPRSLPATVGTLRPCDAEATRLHGRDRVFFYRSFHVAERDVTR